MEHINTLQKYKDLMASGVPEAQAEAHVQALNSSFDSVATKEDLKSLEKDLKIFFGYIVIGFIALEVVWPIVAKKWGL